MCAQDGKGRRCNRRLVAGRLKRTDRASENSVVSAQNAVRLGDMFVIYILDECFFWDNQKIPQFGNESIVYEIPYKIAW